MHDEVRIRQFPMDRLDNVHRQNVAVRLSRKFVSTVRRAAGNGQRVHLGAGDEVDGLIGIREQLVVRQRSFGAVPVFGLAMAAFERAQHAELAFDRGADPVRHGRHACRDLYIVGYSWPASWRRPSANHPSLPR